MSSHNLLSDYLNAKAAFETRAEKLFSLAFRPRIWGRITLVPHKSGKFALEVSVYERHNDWLYCLEGCDPILLNCPDEDLEAVFAAHPPTAATCT